MPSALFQRATRRERAQASQQLQSSPMMAVAREIRRATRGTSGRQQVAYMARQVATPEVRAIIEGIERGGSVTRYSRYGDTHPDLDRLFKSLGPLGKVIQNAVGSGRTAFGRDSWDSAVNLIRAFGGEVMTGPDTPERERGLAAAKQMLEEAGYDVTPRGQGRAPRAGESAITQRGDLGRVVRSQQPPDRDEGLLIETHQRVQSDSVYSFAYVQETEQHGTVYVTFLAWTPGRGKRDAPGATYAYYSVPPKKYGRFRQAAQHSAGEAVWDFLRVRGTSSGHQHPYELVGGVPVQSEGVYIPRKATEEGFMRRAIREGPPSRQRLRRSSLPSEQFGDDDNVNRGRPNRGGPNRGR